VKPGHLPRGERLSLVGHRSLRRIHLPGAAKIEQVLPDRQHAARGAPCLILRTSDPEVLGETREVRDARQPLTARCERRLPAALYQADSWCIAVSGYTRARIVRK
jgi:hypothetical protein